MGRNKLHVTTGGMKNLVIAATFLATKVFTHTHISCIDAPVKDFCRMKQYNWVVGGAVLPTKVAGARVKLETQ